MKIVCLDAATLGSDVNLDVFRQFGEFKSYQMTAANERVERLKGADVVITNPTTLAVALLYDRRLMKAPQVVAKGRGIVAQRIRELARAHGVPVVENKPLAWALFEGVEIGEEISEELYRGVAEILAMVYRLRAG